MDDRDEKGNLVYAALGVHDDSVDGIAEGQKVVRVRMFVNGGFVDEDIPYPEPITTEEQLQKLVLARIKELENK